MTSKEALRLLETRCRFYAQDNDELQEIYESREKLEKDLEVLEILKNYIDFINCHYTDGYYNEKGQTYITLLIPESNKNYTIIKEWLEDENNK